MRIRNLTREADTSRVDFDIVDGKGINTHYHTDKRGDGLWIGEDYMTQVAGTCDFHLRQTSDSGKRAAIKRMLL